LLVETELRAMEKLGILLGVGEHILLQKNNKFKEKNRVTLLIGPHENKKISLVLI